VIVTPNCQRDSSTFIGRFASSPSTLRTGCGRHILHPASPKFPRIKPSARRLPAETRGDLMLA
jgi:hypothetical protein